MTESVSISSPAGILAFIPHMLGRTPENSFVLISMRGNTLGATLRLDAPAAVAPRDYARRAVSYLTADTEATGALLVAYTDDPGTNGQRPFHPYTEALIQELETADMPLRDAWLVTSTGWGNLLCDDQACCTTHPLDTIIDSALNAELIYRGSNPAGVPDPAPFTGNPGRAAAIARQIPQHAPDDLTDVIGAWDAALASGTAPAEETAVTMLAALQNATVRDYLLTAVITEDPAIRGNVPVMGKVFMGVVTAAPDWDRVDRAQDLGHRLLSETPDGYRAPLLFMIGWLHWYKGSSSDAIHYLSLATADVPGYRLAELMTTLINRGALAPVAADKATAYRRRM